MKNILVLIFKLFLGGLFLAILKFKIYKYFLGNYLKEISIFINKRRNKFINNKNIQKVHLNFIIT